MLLATISMKSVGNRMKQKKLLVKIWCIYKHTSASSTGNLALERTFTIASMELWDSFIIIHHSVDPRLHIWVKLLSPRKGHFQSKKWLSVHGNSVRISGTALKRGFRKLLQPLIHLPKEELEIHSLSQNAFPEFNILYMRTWIVLNSQWYIQNQVVKLLSKL